MNKPSYIAFILLFSLQGVLAQGKYEMGMKKAFELWSDGQIEQSSQLFLRIGDAEKDNWIPYYYAAHTYITAAFGQKDATKLDLYLKYAEDYLSKANGISKKNAELHIAKALMLTARLTSDPAAYGQVLSPQIVGLYEQALKIEPDNPRAVFSLAEFEMGAARFFGQDLAPFCERILSAIELFSGQQSDEPYYPSWGEDRARQAAANCNKK
jgi:hypothetical protein